MALRRFLLSLILVSNPNPPNFIQSEFESEKSQVSSANPLWDHSSEKGSPADHKRTALESYQYRTRTRTRLGNDEQTEPPTDQNPTHSVESVRRDRMTRSITITAPLRTRKECPLALLTRLPPSKPYLFGRLPRLFK